MPIRSGEQLDRKGRRDINTSESVRRAEKRVARKAERRAAKKDLESAPKRRAFKGYAS